MTPKSALIAIGWIALAMAVTIGFVWVFQRSLVYLPSQGVPPPPVGVEEVTYQTEDGLTLSGWFMQAVDSLGTVVVFNGNAGNRSNRLPLGQALVDDGFSVLLVDYRGYGGNPGSPSEEGLAFDSRAAVGYARERVGDLPVAYFGESLGAAVAVALTVDEPPEALILRSPWTSLPDVAAVHYWYLPSSLLLHDRFPSLERMPEIDTPLLVIAGTADDIVPVEQSREVYEAANDPKALLEVEGAGHNDAALLDGDEMIEAIVGFLARS